MDTYLEEKLTKGAEELNIKLTAEQKNKLINYLEQLSKWNKVYNLTAIQNKNEMLVRHILDSLAVIPYLNKLKTNIRKDNINIVDVGSGGGLPGVIIATMDSRFKVNCVDSVHKKTAFVQQMRSRLELKNLSAMHSRVEDLKNKGYDILIARAFSTLKTIIHLAGKHVLPNGYIVAMKGKKPTKEIKEIKQITGWQIHSIAPLNVPFLDAERSLVILKKQGMK